MRRKVVDFHPERRILELHLLVSLTPVRLVGIGAPRLSTGKWRLLNTSAGWDSMFQVVVSDVTRYQNNPLAARHRQALECLDVLLTH